MSLNSSSSAASCLRCWSSRSKLESILCASSLAVRLFLVSAPETQARKPCLPFLNSWRTCFPEKKVEFHWPRVLAGSCLLYWWLTCKCASFHHICAKIHHSFRLGQPRLSQNGIIFRRSKHCEGTCFTKSPKVILIGVVIVNSCEAEVPSARATENSLPEQTVSRWYFSTKFYETKSWVDPECTRKTASFPASLPEKHTKNTQGYVRCLD